VAASSIWACEPRVRAPRRLMTLVRETPGGAEVIRRLPNERHRPPAPELVADHSLAPVTAGLQRSTRGASERRVWGSASWSRSHARMRSPEGSVAAAPGTEERSPTPNVPTEANKSPPAPRHPDRAWFVEAEPDLRSAASRTGAVGWATSPQRACASGLWRTLQLAIAGKDRRPPGGRVFQWAAQGQLREPKSVVMIVTSPPP
jgi:hypothetical protein